MRLKEEKEKQNNMANFDFLSRIRTTLENLWGNNEKKAKPLSVSAQEPKQDVNDKGTMQKISDEHFSEQGPALGKQTITADDILRGLTSFAGNNAQVPLATQAAQLAEAGNRLPDPYLPIVLALKETQGGRDVVNRANNGGAAGAGMNNAWNIMYGGKLIDYPDYETALMGGGNWGVNGAPQQGLLGTLTGGLYDNYMRSGNLEDFFSTYSDPSVGNPPMEKQVADYMYLRSLFDK